jgi:hypothetical protein
MKKLMGKKSFMVFTALALILLFALPVIAAPTLPNASKTRIVKPKVLFSENFKGVKKRLPAGWSTTHPDHWYVVKNSHMAGGAVPEMRFTCGYPFMGTARLISPYIDARKYNELELTFNHYVADWVVGNYTLKVQVTTNNGASWQNTDWTIKKPGKDLGPETITVDLSEFAGKKIKIAWVFEGTSKYIKWWYIDDILVKAK